MTIKRTVRSKGVDGNDQFKTEILITLHYETYVATANTGPTGISGDKEPGGERGALVDRTIAHVVSASAEDMDGAGCTKFDINNLRDDQKPRFLVFAIAAGLIGKVLNFTNDNPHLQPNFKYAQMVWNELDRWMYDSHGKHPPSARKRELRQATAHKLAVESAVYEKFMMRESGDDYTTCASTPTGASRPSTSQLVDVVRNAQRRLDIETIRTACSTRSTTAGDHLHVPNADAHGAGHGHAPIAVPHHRRRRCCCCSRRCRACVSTTASRRGHGRGGRAVRASGGGDGGGAAATLVAVGTPLLPQFPNRS